MRNKFYIFQGRADGYWYLRYGVRGKSSIGVFASPRSDQVFEVLNRVMKPDDPWGLRHRVKLVDR